MRHRKCVHVCVRIWASSRAIQIKRSSQGERAHSRHSNKSLDCSEEHMFGLSLHCGLRGDPIMYELWGSGRSRAVYNKATALFRWLCVCIDSPHLSPVESKGKDSFDYKMHFIRLGLSHQMCLERDQLSATADVSPVRTKSFKTCCSMPVLLLLCPPLASSGFACVLLYFLATHMRNNFNIVMLMWNNNG